MTPFDDLLRDPDTTVALVGATDNPAKYGSIIYHDLISRGFEVWPVNPKRSTVGGAAAFASLGDLPEAPDIINVVVPSSVGMTVVREAKALGYTNVWLQPGAESPELINYLQDEGFEYLAAACIMVRARVVGR